MINSRGLSPVSGLQPQFIMLIWRFCIGVPIVVGVVILTYLDMVISNWVQLRGVVLLPIFLVVIGFLCDEVLDLLEAGGLHPRRTTVYTGTLGMAACCWLACAVQEYKSDFVGEMVSPHGWHWAATASLLTLLAFAGGIIIGFAGEILRYTKPGGTLINLSGAMFAISYIGLLSCFIIQLRMAFEIKAVLSLVVVAKMCDIGAYTVGRICGVHKVTPILSPGKTLEGMIGGILFAVLGAWLWFDFVIPWAFSTSWFSGTPRHISIIGWVTFGIAVGAGAILGDLSESLIKRDVMRKDSSRWMPGFGGFLDIFDSLLISAPIAYLWWAFHLVA